MLKTLLYIGGVFSERSEIYAEIAGSDPGSPEHRDRLQPHAD